MPYSEIRPVSSPPLALERRTRTRASVELVAFFHLGIREREPECADVFGDALTMSGLWQDDEFVLDAPADQDLRRRSSDAFRDRLHPRVRQMSPGAERAIGLGGQVAAPVLLHQVLAIAEWVEVDLVGNGWRGGGGKDLLELVHVEIRHAYRARISEALRPLHARPGPGWSTLGPVHQVEVHVLEPQALETRLYLSDRILGTWIELRRDKDLVAVQATLTESLADALFIPIALGRVNMAIAQLKSPADGVLGLRPLGGLPHAQSQRWNLVPVSELVLRHRF